MRRIWPDHTLRYNADRQGAGPQIFNLDQLRNWAGFTDQGSTQTRTHNAANEIGTISGQLDWIDPAYDSAGNMISGPMAGDETTRLHFVYDAWNRMTGVRTDDGGEPGDLVAAYEYDGANRRIQKTVGSGQSAVGGDYFYNERVRSANSTCTVVTLLGAAITRPNRIQCLENRLGAAWVLIADHRDGYHHQYVQPTNPALALVLLSSG